VQALPKVAAAFDEPFGNSSALPAYFCARMAAADGIGVLLAGDGGDELFAGNTRYAGQKIFEDYRRAPEWMRTRVIEPLLKNLPEKLPLVSKGRSFIRQANTTLPKRLQYYSFLEQNSPHEVFMPAFLNQVDKTRPMKLLNNIYQLPEQASTLNRMLFLDWQITLADNDLRKVTQACALADVKVRYPMLDDELVEFSTGIPTDRKLPGNTASGRNLRRFYKKALTGWLPKATINKGKHGFGLPFGVWMKNHRPLQELAFDNILKLKARGIFLPRFLDQAIASHRDGHAAYFGELVWVLTCLELWLSANQRDYRFR
jgi:asparagine synthase (glutamine-hydrolysing)